MNYLLCTKHMSDDSPFTDQLVIRNVCLSTAMNMIAVYYDKTFIDWIQSERTTFCVSGSMYIFSGKHHVALHRSTHLVLKEIP